MDIFAHALWANAVAREANKVSQNKNKKFHISAGWVAFWGIFPDLFAFSIPFALRFYFILIGNNPFSSFFQRPLSDYRFPYGVQWSNQYFMIINYGALLIVWGRFLYKDFLAKKISKI